MQVNLAVICEVEELVGRSLSMAGFVDPLALNDSVTALEVVNAEGEYSPGDDISWGSHELERSQWGRVHNSCPLGYISKLDELSNVLAELITAIVCETLDAQLRREGVDLGGYWRGGAC